MHSTKSIMNTFNAFRKHFARDFLYVVEDLYPSRMMSMQEYICAEHPDVHVQCVGTYADAGNPGARTDPGGTRQRKPFENAFQDLASSLASEGDRKDLFRGNPAEQQLQETTSQLKGLAGAGRGANQYIRRVHRSIGPTAGRFQRVCRRSVYW